MPAFDRLVTLSPPREYAFRFAFSRRSAQVPDGFYYCQADGADNPSEVNESGEAALYADGTPMFWAEAVRVGLRVPWRITNTRYANADQLRIYPLDDIVIRGTGTLALSAVEDGVATAIATFDVGEPVYQASVYRLPLSGFRWVDDATQWEEQAASQPANHVAATLALTPAGSRRVWARLDEADAVETVTQDGDAAYTETRVYAMRYNPALMPLDTLADERGTWTVVSVAPEGRRRYATVQVQRQANAR